MTNVPIRSNYSTILAILSRSGISKVHPYVQFNCLRISETVQNCKVIGRIAGKSTELHHNWLDGNKNKHALRKADSKQTTVEPQQQILTKKSTAVVSDHTSPLNINTNNIGNPQSQCNRNAIHGIKSAHP